MILRHPRDYQQPEVNDYPWTSAQREVVFSELRGQGHLAGLFCRRMEVQRVVSVAIDPKYLGRER